MQQNLSANLRGRDLWLAGVIGQGGEAGGGGPPALGGGRQKSSRGQNPAPYRCNLIMDV